MTITRLGATKKYAANWGHAFRKESASGGQTASGTTAKKKPAAAKRKPAQGKN